jgi:hypothetical protein
MPLLLHTLNETKYIVAYLLNARTVEPEKQSLLVMYARNNGRLVFSRGVRATTVAMQRRGKHASSTIEALLSARSVPRSYELRICKTTGAAVQLRVQVWSVKQRATARQRKLKNIHCYDSLLGNV